MKYARIVADAVAEIRDMASNFNPDEVRHKYDYRLANYLPDPAYNAATEKLSGEAYAINPDSVDVVKVVVALTQAEIDARAQAAADADELAQIKAVYQDLKNGVGTQLVRLTRCERVLARMLKDIYQP